jgi:hypothetical protein
MFCSILKYESKGKSSTYTDFQLRYIFAFSMFHSILGEVYKSKSLLNDFFLPSRIFNQHLVATLTMYSVSR